MNTNPEYDALADVYDLWASADPAFEPTHDFYVDLGCYDTEAIVVELGVGTGRIAIDIAKRNKDVIGVDISLPMLNQCRQSALRAGVQDHIDLIQCDIQSLKLPQRATLIILPFRSIGHFLSLDSKRQTLQTIHDQLAPGGRFVFDHYVYSEKWARDHNGIPRLMCSRQLPNRKSIFIWDTYRYDFPEQQMNCIITIERSDECGTVISRVHCPLTFSWIHPEQVRQLAADVGFEVEALYGDFSYAKFDDNSLDQVWFLRRPK